MFADGAARLAHAASVLLGWRPEEFWTTTPTELALALAPPCGGAAGPDTAEVAALMARFPDQERS